MKRLALVIVAALAFAACSSSDAPAAVKLDGSPRVPDREGVVTAVSEKQITLDDKTELKVAKKVLVFSTYNRRSVPLAGLKGKYVHLGVKGSTAEWIAQIGVVQGTPPTALYEGELLGVDGQQMTFKDGTVLRLAKGLTAPAGATGHTLAVVDAATHFVTGATFAPVTASTTRSTN